MSLPSRLPSDPDVTVTLAAATAAGITITAIDWPKLSIAPADQLTPELRQMVAADKWAIMAHLLNIRLDAGINRLRSLEARGLTDKEGHVHQLARFEVLLSCYQAAWQAAADPEYRARLEDYHATYAAKVTA